MAQLAAPGIDSRVFGVLEVGSEGSLVPGRCGQQGPGGWGVAAACACALEPRAGVTTATVSAVKYLGLLAMSKILRTHPKSVQAHKDLVLQCLGDRMSPHPPAGPRSHYTEWCVPATAHTAPAACPSLLSLLPGVREEPGRSSQAVDPRGQGQGHNLVTSCSPRS